MNFFQLCVYGAYMGLNLLIGAAINTALFKTEVLDSMLSPLAIGIGIALVLIERNLPQKIKYLQLLLSLLLVVVGMKGGENTKALFAVIGIAVVCIKFYALKLCYNRIREMITGKTSSAVAAGSGKDFYNSQQWRALRYAVLNEQGRCCVSCGESRVTDENGKMISYHVDHIKPRSTHPHLALDKKNMQVMCSHCNLGKSNKWDIDHREERGIA